MSQTSKVLRELYKSQNCIEYLRFVENEDLRRRRLTKRQPTTSKNNHTPIRKRRSDPRIDDLIDTIDPEIFA